MRLTGFRDRIIWLLFTAAMTMTLGAVSPALAKGNTYTLQEGDNLWTVARKFDTHVHDLALINKLDRNKPLKPGTVIQLPSSAKAPSSPPKSKAAALPKPKVKGAPYTVRQGDSAWLIARRHNMRTTELLAANGLDEKKPLKPGQTIIMPGVAATKAVARGPALEKKAPAQVTRRPHLKPAAVAVVTERRAALYTQTTLRSEKLRVVERGKRLAVVGKKADWLKLQLAGGEIAWIPARYALVQKLPEKAQRVAAAPKNKHGEAKRVLPAALPPDKVAAIPIAAVIEPAIELEKSGEVTPSQESKFIQALTEELARNPQAADQIAGTSALLLSHLPIPGGLAKAKLRIPNANGKYAAHALKFTGVRYRRGGLTSRGGMDCSGLVCRVLKDYGKDAPHNAAALFNTGHPIDKSQLQAGDLVFFKNTYRRGVSHCGIYIGKGKFVHASTHGRRVRITSLSEAYYIDHWAGARRVR